MLPLFYFYGMNTVKRRHSPPWVRKLRRYGIRLWWYWAGGVWNDTRSNWRIDLAKTINLSVRSILDTNMQQKAAALTFNTMLALVPTLAMIFAIGRGFGFQNIVESEIFKFILGGTYHYTAFFISGINILQLVFTIVQCV